MQFARLCCCAGAAATVLFAHVEVRAQSAPTCSFNPVTATVRVTVDGVPATLSQISSGVLRLNGVPCEGATTANTDTIIIRGGALQDNVTLSGDFTPGLTPEAGVSEVEIRLVSIQNFTWALGQGDNTMSFAAGGIDNGGDGDVDVTGLSVSSLRRVMGGAGDDVLDFSDHAGNVALDGEAGDDDLTGGSGNNLVSGGPGDDTLRGGPGHDRLEGDAGNDTELGGSGNDTFREGPIANGSDTMTGGPGKDTVDYGRRSAGVTATLGSGGNDDGEAGEADVIGGDVENATGGSGDDTLVGTPGRNMLRGGDGNDDLFGEANVDLLFGGAGDDVLDGGTGPDNLQGEEGNDTLIAGAGSIDKFFGGDGDDDIIGNTDGRAEPVNCGAGNDTAEPNDEDNFVDCEF
jgi:Ca2+-binding RTX toxin-like protein